MIAVGGTEETGWYLLGGLEHVTSRDLMRYVKMFGFLLDSCRKTHSCEIRRSYVASELFEHQMQSLAFAWAQISLLR